MCMNQYTRDIFFKHIEQVIVESSLESHTEAAGTLAMSLLLSQVKAAKSVVKSVTIFLVEFSRSNVALSAFHYGRIFYHSAFVAK